MNIKSLAKTYFKLQQQIDKLESDKDKIKSELLKLMSDKDIVVIDENHVLRIVYESNYGDYLLEIVKSK